MKTHWTRQSRLEPGFTTGWHSNGAWPRPGCRRRSSATRWTCSTTPTSTPAATGNGANAPSSATSRIPRPPTGPLGEGHDSRPYAVEWPAPTLGQHNREVLSRLLGLSDAELDALEADDIIGAEPVA